MEKKKINQMKIFANEIRIETLKQLSEIGSGHVGGALGLAELLAVLYSGEMKVNPHSPNDSDRDYLIMSKGHAGPALYSTLALKGFFPMEQLKTLNQPGTMLPSHCDHNKTPGVDMTTGSLGQGIGVAVGIALGNKIAKRENYTYCVIGDGEMDEGSVWESIMLAPNLELNKFIVILDNNGLKIDDKTSDYMSNISDKVSKFGWNVFEADGHNIEDIGKVITSCKETVCPSFINMRTIKGKGWEQYENKINSHYVGNISKEDVSIPINILLEKIDKLKNYNA